VVSLSIKESFEPIGSNISHETL